MSNKVIVLGTSHSNDLGLIRSLGEAGISIVFIMVAKHDNYHVQKSVYLKNAETYITDTFDKVHIILNSICDRNKDKQPIICTNDKAAEWIDKNEPQLSKCFTTPLRGKQIGKYFNKEKQCEIASKYGITAPKSYVYYNGEDFGDFFLNFPVLTKPLESSEGSKADIHICKDFEELMASVNNSRGCKAYIIQEFIDKDFELNALGVRTEMNVIWGGAIRKIRHYPWITGACSFGQIVPVDLYGVPTAKIEKILEEIGYYGVFSVEFLRKGDTNYFMEINFRHDGLGYVSTCAGINLPALYIEGKPEKNIKQFIPVYMMNFINDFRLCLKGRIGIKQWLISFKKTDAFIDYAKGDYAPFFALIKQNIKGLFKITR